MPQNPSIPASPRWMRLVLIFAGWYNLLWGTWAVLLPRQAFDLAGIAPPNYPSLWQCIGMIVGVYGVGYLIAARNPMIHWPIILAGLLGKICGPIGFACAAATGELPWRLGYVILTNDVAWWAPFTLMLLAARRHHLPQRTSATS